jgi:hypothetical protein
MSSGNFSLDPFPKKILFGHSNVNGCIIIKLKYQKRVIMSMIPPPAAQQLPVRFSPIITACYRKSLPFPHINI